MKWGGPSRDARDAEKSGEAARQGRAEHDATDVVGDPDRSVGEARQLKTSGARREVTGRPGRDARDAERNST